MIRSILSALLVLTACAAIAQGNTAPTLKVTLPKEAKAGSKVQGTVEVTFATGLHGYQNPPTDQYQIPVKVLIDNKEFVLAKVSYPKGVMRATGGDTKPAGVYEGKIKIPVTITVPKAVGATSLKIVVNYQQCNEQACFPPSSVSSTVKLQIKK